MPIVATDIVFRYSGSGTDATSLGGAIHANAWSSGLHNMFDVVSSAESSAGDVEYRGFYVLNNHGTLTLQDARIYFTTAADDIDVALTTAAVNSSMPSIANESTAPGAPDAGITFTHPTTYAGGLQLNGSTGLAPAASKGVWLKRTIPAAAPAESNHTETIKVEGDTAG